MASNATNDENQKELIDTSIFPEATLVVPIKKTNSFKIKIFLTRKAERGISELRKPLKEHLTEYMNILFIRKNQGILSGDEVEKLYEQFKNASTNKDNDNKFKDIAVKLFNSKVTFILKPTENDDGFVAVGFYANKVVRNLGLSVLINEIQIYSKGVEENISFTSSEPDSQFIDMETLVNLYKNFKKKRSSFPKDERSERYREAIHVIKFLRKLAKWEREYYEKRVNISLYKYKKGKTRPIEGYLETYLELKGLNGEMKKDPLKYMRRYFGKIVKIINIDVLCSELAEHVGNEICQMLCENKDSNIHKMDEEEIRECLRALNGNKSPTVKGYISDQNTLLVFEQYEEILEKWKESGTIIVIPDSDHLKTKIDALNNILTYWREDIFRILQGETQNYEIDKNLKFLNPSISESKEEAKSQARAIKKALSAKDIFLIQGPPGTGKTTVITEIIRQLSRRDKTILLTAPTHVAIDNVFERITEFNEFDEIWGVRFGRPDRISPKILLFTERRRFEGLTDKILKKLNEVREIEDKTEIEKIQESVLDYIESNKGEFSKILLKNVNLIGSTPIVAHKLPQRHYILFDVVIIDEASKLPLQDFLVLAVKGKKWIIVGDPKQLQPYQDQNLVAYFLEKQLNNIYKRGKNKKSLTPEKISELSKMIAWIVIRFYEVKYSNANNYDIKLDNQLFNEKLKNYIFKNKEMEGKLQELEEYREEIISLLTDGRFLDFARKLIVYYLNGTISYFWEKISSHKHKQLLNHQFRSHKMIAEFSSNTFYDGKIKTPNTIRKRYNKNWKIILSNKRYYPGLHLFSTEKDPKRGEKEEGKNGGLYYNELEVEIVISLLTDLIRDFYKRKNEYRGMLNSEKLTVGITSPYWMQVLKIKRALGERIKKLEEDLRLKLDAKGFYYHLERGGHEIELEINVVDRFQGKEFDVIFISFVRSNGEGRIGFLDYPNRINVAVTRGRHFVFMIGDANTLKGGGRGQTSIAKLVKFLEDRGKVWREYRKTNSKR